MIINKYQEIAIDTPGYAWDYEGEEKVIRYFAGVDDLGRPLVFIEGETSLTAKGNMYFYNFEPLSPIINKEAIQCLEKVFDDWRKTK